MSTSDPYPDLNAFPPELIRDMNLGYVRTRAETPVRQVPGVHGFPIWVVTRYDEARMALSEPNLAKHYAGVGDVLRAKMSGEVDYDATLRANMISLDPPDHTRLRRLVTKAFTARRVEDLRPRVEAIAAELLDDMAAHDEVDLLEAFAVPLPIRVIWELLGVDEARRDDFAAWSRAMVGADLEAGGEAAATMGAYVPELIASKRENPGGDLLSALIEATEDEDRLTEAELVAMVFLLLFAGHETTTNLIGNSVFELLRHPEQLAALRENPELASAVVEETLRVDSPVGLATVRYTAAPVRLGEVEIPAGEIVLISLLSANRDERRFEDSESFDVHRSSPGHLAFGHGIHFCMGAALARMEGHIALNRLLERYPRLECATSLDAIQWRLSPMIRGLDVLPVRLNA